jgi:predicted porin
MKRANHAIHATAAAALAAFGGAAQAQSNITIYGSLDAGVAYVSNVAGNSVSRVDQGTMQPDRFGFRGTEDLGGGTKGVFQLEGGFFTDTGNQTNANRLFNRLAVVGLSSDTYGTVVLGNMPDLVFEYAGKTSNAYQLTNWYLFHPGNLDSLANTSQFNNAVRYTSPSFSGLTASAMIGLGEVAGDSKKGRNTSAAVQYIYGPAKVLVAYSRLNDRAAGYAGTFLTALGVGNATSVFDGLTTWAVGGGYVMEHLRLNTVYTQVKADLPNRVGFKQKNLDLGAAWTYRPKSTLNFGYTHTKQEAAHWNQVSVSHVYAFSKRTEFYIQGAYQKANSDAKFAFQNSTGASSDRSQYVTTIGVHHSF